MNRREILAGAGVLSTALMSGVAFGADRKSDGSAPTREQLKKIIDTSFDCLKTGEACGAHCVEMLSKGDTSMKTCYGTVQNMMAACSAMIKVGTVDSAKPETIKKLAGVCADLCKECAEACKVHSDHHAVCKACMDSCNKCIDACTQIS
jgi:Cys-rich four helix bundle protein (predicted Tat secretion target)